MIIVLLYLLVGKNNEKTGEEREEKKVLELRFKKSILVDLGFKKFENEKIPCFFIDIEI